MTKYIFLLLIIARDLVYGSTTAATSAEISAAPAKLTAALSAPRAAATPAIAVAAANNIRTLQGNGVDAELCKPFNKGSCIYNYIKEQCPQMCSKVGDAELCKSLDKGNCKTNYVKDLCPQMCSKGVDAELCKSFIKSNCKNTYVKYQCPQMCSKDDFIRYHGHDNFFGSSQCSQIGLTYRSKTLQECKTLCDADHKCTAINYGIMDHNCELEDCGYPTSLPSGHSERYEGWSKNVDECLSSPCEHGTCIDEFNGFTCNCTLGWEGNTCQLDVDDCLSSPCEHGTCIDEVNGFTCNCNSGWEGNTCQLDVDECLSSPCEHGTCIDEVNGFSCNCTLGFEGNTCQLDVDECLSSPCEHGTCIDEVNGFTCYCPLGWEGNTCQLDDFSRYHGHDNYFTHKQCSQIGLPIVSKTLQECKTLCDADHTCTAINYGIRDHNCELEACGSPPPLPSGHSEGYEGWSKKEILNDFNRYHGHDNYFKPEQCSQIGRTIPSKTRHDCSTLCDADHKCTAFNYGISNHNCELEACGSPPPLPSGHHEEYEGWSKKEILKLRTTSPATTLAPTTIQDYTTEQWNPSVKNACIKSGTKMGPTLYSGKTFGVECKKWCEEKSGCKSIDYRPYSKDKECRLSSDGSSEPCNLRRTGTVFSAIVTVEPPMITTTTASPFDCKDDFRWCQKEHCIVNYVKKSCPKTCGECKVEDGSRYHRKRGKFYTSYQCDQIGSTHLSKTVPECKSLCDITSQCTAFNYDIHNNHCELEACGSPPPLPSGVRRGYEGWGKEEIQS